MRALWPCARYSAPQDPAPLFQECSCSSVATHRMISQAKTHIGCLVPKNAFACGANVLVSATASAPLLTHLESPEDFGPVTFYVTCATSWPSRCRRPTSLR